MMSNYGLCVCRLGRGVYMGGGGGVRGACLHWVKCDICIMELLSSIVYYVIMNVTNLASS